MEDWLGLAVINGNPRCGLVVVVKDGTFYTTGHCGDDDDTHYHLRSDVEKAKEILTQRNGRTHT